MYAPQPQWYKDAIIYELHVRAFHDSVGDGHGDFTGLTQKLDYLRDLGVTAIWLLPFYPSPLRDDGYDIADYTSIHPQFGTLDSFRAFLDAAHDRGLNVITELVINHTSDQHPWFQRARRSLPGSVERDFYVWSDTPEKYRDARIIFKDFEPSNWTYDHVAKAYYWHRFYSHQPDLNYDNYEVWKAIFPVVDFWLEMGVDGLRLDAVPYLYEREGTNCENLPQTHAFLKALRRHVDERFPNRMLLAEANQWPEDAVTYFGNGDESHMNFHFPLMPRLFMSIQREDRFPLVDIMDQTPAIPEPCQWAIFLRNHDELTLEMVTDEERDYMYRAYALDSRAKINLGIRHRLAPLLGNNRRRIELMNSLLFSLPGAPVIYYGDEIGMGDNIYLGDRNGVRTPMQWSSDRNAGFSRANPQKLYLPVVIDPQYHHEAINVEAQQNNPQSLLWWMKRIIDVRKRHPAFSRGTLEFLHPDNRRVLAFIRSYQGEDLLLVANLSRFVQYVELDLTRYMGVTPIELFGSTPFPPVGSLPYLLTLGPHAFYWLQLTPATAAAERAGAVDGAAAVPELPAGLDWDELVNGKSALLEARLPGFLAGREARWPDGPPKRAKLLDAARLATGAHPVQLAHVAYQGATGIPHATILPIGRMYGEPVQTLLEQHADLALFRAADEALFDASTEPSFASDVLAAFRQDARVRTREGGTLHFRKLPAFEQMLGEPDALVAAPVKIEHFNRSMQLGHRAIWKLYRLVEEGIHPEVELGEFLTYRAQFPHAPALIGVLEHQRPRQPPVVWGVLHEYVPVESDAWQRTLDELSDFFERALAQALPAPRPTPAWSGLAASLATPGSGENGESVVGYFLDEVALMGRRTAELHAALAGAIDPPDLAPEPFTSLYQRSLYQSMRTIKLEVFDRLRRHLPKLDEATRDQAQALLDHDQRLTRCFQALLDQRLEAVRIRCHGDYHLGQLLHTGKDYMLIDFEGPTATPLGERRIKRSPLRDVAWMLRSFDYAVRASLLGLQSGRGRAPGSVRAEDAARLAPWWRAWLWSVSHAFGRSYRATCAAAGFAPADDAAWPVMLRAYLLEKGLRELDHELRERTTWIEVPLTGLLELLDDPAT
jgi:maltose alpha-D-glucosyltransferase/alpha-amylase